MAGIQNNIIFGGGFKLEASSAADIQNMQAPFSTNVSNINHTGNPEGVVSANPSSFSHDPVSGVVYLKLSGTGNTGWTPILNPSAPLTITGNSGLPLVPTAGNWNIVGSGSLTSSGLLSTLTFALTGLTANNVLVGAGTGTITKVPPSATAGIALVSNGAAVDPSFTTTLVAGGGTGITSYNQGDLIYASSTTILATLAKNTTATRYLANTGTSNNPAWDQVNLANGVTGTLPLANGGTNANLTASNGGIFYSTATAGAILAGTATARQMLQSGANTTPAWSTATWPATTTINQILYSSAANTVSEITAANNGVLITGATGVPSLLAAGTTGQVLVATTGSPPSWGTIPSSFNPNSNVNISDEFLSMAFSSVIGISDQTWTCATGVVWPQSTSEAGHPGVLANPSMAASGGGNLILNTSTGGILLGGGILTLNWIFKIVTLSTGTNRYILRIGLGNTALLDQSSGLYFEYSDNINSANWNYKSAKATVRTTNNSSVAVTAAWHNAQIVVNAAASSVSFFMDGVSLGAAITTNIPTVVTAPFIDMLQGAGTVAAGSVLIDLMYFNYALTTAR